MRRSHTVGERGLGNLVRVEAGPVAVGVAVPHPADEQAPRKRAHHVDDEAREAHDGEAAAAGSTREDTETHDAPQAAVVRVPHGQTQENKLFVRKYACITSCKVRISRA